MDNKMTISRPRIKTPAKKNWVRRHPRNRIDTTAEIGTNDNNTIACCHFMDQRLRLQAHVVLFFIFSNVFGCRRCNCTGVLCKE